MRRFALLAMAMSVLLALAALGCGKKEPEQAAPQGPAKPRIEVEKTAPPAGEVANQGEQAETLGEEVAPVKEAGPEPKATGAAVEAKKPPASVTPGKAAATAGAPTKAVQKPSVPPKTATPAVQPPKPSAAAAAKPAPSTASDKPGVISAVEAGVAKLAPGGKLTVSDIRIAGDWALAKGSVTGVGAGYAVCKKAGGAWQMVAYGGSAGEAAEKASVPAQARAGLGIQ